MSTSIQNIARLLGTQKDLGMRVVSLHDLETVVAGGLPRTALDRVIQRFEDAATKTANELKYQIVPRATYQRSQRLALQPSETVERLARLYTMALDAFESDADAAQFMMTHHPELENRSPFSAGLTELGGRAVEEVIARGMHGLPA